MYEDIILTIITRGIRHTYKCLVAFTTFQLITGIVQFINLKSYDEACLLRQCFTISITTIKTVTQTQTKPICLSSVDSFFSFMVSDRFSSRVLEVVSLSAFTSVLSLVAVSFFLFLLKSPSICPSASNGGFSVRLSGGFRVS